MYAMFLSRSQPNLKAALSGFFAVASVAAAVDGSVAFAAAVEAAAVASVAFAAFAAFMGFVAFVVAVAA
jgi:Na+-transporting NADH:ubiquinone oxidoreductase subunit NqrE